MVFPSLMFQIDQGLVSQLSAWIVILFSFLIYRFKKVMLTIFVVIATIVTIQHSHAFAGISPYSAGSWSSCNNTFVCANNVNYYGRSNSYVPPVYMYPQLPYQSMWPQQNYYFPHTPSPYQSSDCPFCNQMQLYNYPSTQPMIFPNSYQFPGGGIT